MSVLKYYDPITKTYKPLSMLIGGGAGSGDKYYELSFVSSSEIIVEHMLGKHPSITVLDTANDEVEGDVEHLSTNSVVIRFSAPFSGKVICN